LVESTLNCVLAPCSAGTSLKPSSRMIYSHLQPVMLFFTVRPSCRPSPSTENPTGAEYSSDDEGTQSQTDEGEGADDADEFKVYHQHDHHTYLFSTLKTFRESSILTDLTLKTEENKLSGSVGVQPWSVCLGPEVDPVGLEAILEFAYTGIISSVNRHDVQRIRAAAESLGALRVWQLCVNDEDPLSKQNEDEQIFAAEQMELSLQFIKQQWMDRVGCDVVLEALGGSLHGRYPSRWSTDFINPTLLFLYDYKCLCDALQLFS
uniref:BTB domain-containing protein n=1 Tax=Nothobranchius furzeri TaxID=105023 RepID=A0A8C6M1V4_NOTFU